MASSRMSRSADRSHENLTSRMVKLAVVGSTRLMACAGSSTQLIHQFRLARTTQSSQRRGGGVASSPDEQLDLIANRLVGQVAAVNECVKDVARVVARQQMRTRGKDGFVADRVEPCVVAARWSRHWNRPRVVRCRSGRSVHHRISHQLSRRVTPLQTSEWSNRVTANEPWFLIRR